MTRKDFISGNPFMYSGHFQNLKRHPLLVNEKGKLVDEKAQESWEIQEISETRAIIFKSRYGRIVIFYKECELKKEDN